MREERVGDCEECPYDPCGSRLKNIGQPVLVLYSEYAVIRLEKDCLYNLALDSANLKWYGKSIYPMNPLCSSLFTLKVY